MCMQVAAGLMAACLPLHSCAARLQLFVGGPSTVGAGKVVERALLEPIRSHKACCVCFYQRQVHSTLPVRMAAS